MHDFQMCPFEQHQAMRFGGCRAVGRVLVQLALVTYGLACAVTMPQFIRMHTHDWMFALFNGSVTLAVASYWINRDRKHFWPAYWCRNVRGYFLMIQGSFGGEISSWVTERRSVDNGHYESDYDEARRRDVLLCVKLGGWGGGNHVLTVLSMTLHGMSRRGVIFSWFDHHARFTIRVVRNLRPLDHTLNFRLGSCNGELWPLNVHEVFLVLASHGEFDGERNRPTKSVTDIVLHKLRLEHEQTKELAMARRWHVEPSERERQLVAVIADAVVDIRATVRFGRSSEAQQIRLKLERELDEVLLADDPLRRVLSARGG